jgi:hypothetical protein
MWYAAVQVEIAPSEELRVDDQLDEKTREYAVEEGWYDQIVFGVCDVMILQPVAPYKDFRLTIHAIDFNDIESNAMAFRLAARDAAEKILEEVRSLTQQRPNQPKAANK